MNRGKEPFRSLVLKTKTEEKEKYNSYLQLCSYFKVAPDPLVIANWKAKQEILEKLLAGTKS